jgi:cell division protein DivIC
MKRKKTGFLFKLIVLALAVAISVKLVDQRIKIREAEERNQQLLAQYESQQIVNGELKGIVSNGVQEEYIARIAREKLGYVMPEEIIFIDTSSK